MSLELQREGMLFGKLLEDVFSSWKEIGFHYPKQSCCGFFKVVKNRQGRTFKFYLGGCQHALDRLNFSGPTERIWAVRYHWEL